MWQVRSVTAKSVMSTAPLRWLGCQGAAADGGLLHRS
ncbi:hypothetical protein QFZ76_000823 [Streptomyces sp. V4I2]|nr:hypothetical protein [Streptomyces sp. V4I2]